MSSPNGTLSTGAAAKYLGIAHQTLLNWVYKRYVAYSVTPSGRYRFTTADLDEAVRKVEKRP